MSPIGGKYIAWMIYRSGPDPGTRCPFSSSGDGPAMIGTPRLSISRAPKFLPTGPYQCFEVPCSLLQRVILTVANVCETVVFPTRRCRVAYHTDAEWYQIDSNLIA